MLLCHVEHVDHMESPLKKSASLSCHVELGTCGALARNVRRQPTAVKLNQVNQVESPLKSCASFSYHVEYAECLSNS